MNKIYLASKSPRRQTLLRQINIDFELIDSEIDESDNNNEKPLHYVRRMSIEKARAGWISNKRVNNFVVLAADTSIAIADRILGKPTNRKNAYEMLMMLSNKTHQVITCVSVIYDSKSSLKEINVKDVNNMNIETIDSITNVSFMKLSDQDIEEYLETNEWQDKAGSYAIQGYVAKYIKIIEGSYSGVVGLPLYETSQLLNRVGN